VNAPLQTKASSNAKSLLCDIDPHDINPHFTGPPGTVPISCSPYEQAFGPTKFGHGNTLFGWWTSETAITGTPAVVSCALLCHPGSQAALVHRSQLVSGRLSA